MTKLKAEHCKAACDTLRLDAFDAPMILATALEHVQTEATATLYPALRSRQLLPKMDGIPAGATTVNWFEYDHAGMAEIITNYTTDLPLSDLAARKNISPIETIGTAYHYSVQDVDAFRVAMESGRQATLDVSKAQLADEFIERKIDELALIGDTVHNIPGFARNANVTTVSAAAAAGGALAPEWTGVDKTPQEILDDMVAGMNAVVTASKGIHEARIVAMGVPQYQKINTTFVYTSTGTPTTIKQAFLQLYPGTMIERWPALATAGTGGVPLVIYYDPSPGNLGLVVPRESTQEPPQAKSLGFIVPVHASTGGCIIKRPLCVVYQDDV